MHLGTEMNRATLFLLGSLMMLLNCATAHGQGCRTVLQPEFSVYNSASGDGTNIYTSVTMQGYANVSPGPGCNMNSATHHVGAENKLNNVDHWTYSAKAVRLVISLSPTTNKSSAFRGLSTLRPGTG